MLTQDLHKNIDETLDISNLILKEGWLQVSVPGSKESVFYYSVLRPHCLKFYSNANQRTRCERMILIEDCLSVTKTFCMFEKPSISLLIEEDGAYLLTTELNEDVDDWIEKLRLACSSTKSKNSGAILKKFSSDSNNGNNQIQTISVILKSKDKMTKTANNRDSISESELQRFGSKESNTSYCIKIDQVKNNGCHDKINCSQTSHNQDDQFGKNHSNGQKTITKSKTLPWDEKKRSELQTSTSNLLAEFSSEFPSVSNSGMDVIRPQRSRKELPWIRHIHPGIGDRKSSMDGLNCENPLKSSTNNSMRNLSTPNGTDRHLEPYMKKSSELLSSTDSNYATAQLSDETPNPLNRYPPISDLRKSESPFDFLNSCMPHYDSSTMPARENGTGNNTGQVPNMFFGGSPKMLLDPAYASSIFINIMELWNFLLQEERNFWQFQLCNILHSFGADTNEIGFQLNDINQFHTEKITSLWKRVYEHWVPRDYLEYLSDEMRQVCTTFNKIIDKLFTAIEQLGCVNPSITNSCKKMAQESTDRMSKLIGTDWIAQDTITRPSIAKHRTQSLNDLTALMKSKGLQESHRMWCQVRDLMRDSHHHLLDQVRHVVEMVGAALDADMEDTIIGAQKSGIECAEPLTGPPDAGLKVVAKLHAVAIDLESRLEAIWQNTKLDLHDSSDDVNRPRLSKPHDANLPQEPLSKTHQNQECATPEKSTSQVLDVSSKQTTPIAIDILRAKDSSRSTEETINIDERDISPVSINISNGVKKDMLKPVWAILKNKPYLERVNSPVVWVFQDFDELEKYQKHSLATRSKSTLPFIQREADDSELVQDMTLQLECERT